MSCHNERTLRGNLSLEGFTLDSADETGAISEMMIQKLRADMMPPPGARRPSDDSLLDLVESLEAHMHDAAAAYLNAAAEISRLAVGDVSATASETQYRIPRWVSQTERVDGAPFGTRGGTSDVHNFPADSQDLERLLSVPTVHSSSTRAMSMRAAKKCDRVQATERAIEQQKYEQAHND